MKYLFQLILNLLILVLVASPLASQKTQVNAEKSSIETDFSDRKAVLNAIENFYIGDHTGSIKHKKLSMHEKGAYRSVNRDGVYYDSVFQLDSDDSDTSYKEELLSIEIYGKLALGRLRQVHLQSDEPHYKLMILHKADNAWKITTIIWGTGITQ